MDAPEGNETASRLCGLSMLAFCAGRRVLLLGGEGEAPAGQIAEAAVEFAALMPSPPSLPYPAARFEVVICWNLDETWLREAARVLRADGLLTAVAAPERAEALREALAFRFRNFALARRYRFAGELILPDRGARSLADGGDRHNDSARDVRAEELFCLASDAPLPPFGAQFLAAPEPPKGVPQQKVDELLQQLSAAVAQARAAKAREAALIARIARQQLEQRRNPPPRSLSGVVAATWRRLRMLYPNVLGGPAPKVKPAAPPRPAARATEDQVADMALAARLRLPQAAAPAVSVIVPSYGQVGFTLRCLASIAEAPPLAGIEVLVAEDASGDPAVELLARIPGLRLLNNRANLGFLRNCNAAARVARGEMLLFLNNDAELRPGAIDALLATLRAWPSAGMVGAKLLFTDGTLQEAGGIVWNDASAWNWGRGADPDGSAYNYPREVDYCSGAAILLRRDLFAALGGFDEAFAPAYYEDTDLAFRIRARGLKVVYEPDAVVVHHEGVSHGSDPNSGGKACQTVNRQRFLDRWRDALAKQHYPNACNVLRARDQAKGRPVILIVDHYVPEPDRDAGSRVIDGVIKTLHEAGWLVKFRPENGAASGPYAERLRRHGIEILSGNDADAAAWLERYGGELDHVLVSRPDVAAKYLPYIVRHASQAALSYFGHDIHHARLRREAAMRGDAALHAQAADTEAVERRIWASVDSAIYLSDEEAAAVRASVPGAMASAISPYSFAEFPHRSAPPSGRDILFVAGFAHPPNVDAAIWLVREILPLVRTAVPEARLILAGSNPSPAVLALAGTGVEVTGWIDDAALAARYAQSRVAVVPLRFGAGVKGKVAEALAHGVPLVSTTTGAQGLPELPKICAVSDDPASIASALVRLLTDDLVWRAASAAQSDYAESMFSAARLRQTLLQALAAADRQARRSGRVTSG